MDEYLDVGEAADLIGISVGSLRHRIFRKEIPYKKLGRRVMFSKPELEKFLRALPGVSAEQALQEIGRIHGREKATEEGS